MNMLARMKNRRKKFQKSQTIGSNIVASMLGKVAVEAETSKEHIKPLTTTTFDGKPLDIVPVKIDLLPTQTKAVKTKVSFLNRIAANELRGDRQPLNLTADSDN